MSPRMRFNPVELTLPPGTMDATFRQETVLPIYFDVQCMEWQVGAGPERKWTYV